MMYKYLKKGKLSTIQDISNINNIENINYKQTTFFNNKKKSLIIF